MGITCKEAMNDIKVLIEYFKSESGCAYPVCLDKALESMEKLEKLENLVDRYEADTKALDNYMDKVADIVEG